MAKKIGAAIALDGEKEFKSAVINATKSLTTMKSELKLVETQFQGQANTMAALTSKHEALSKVLTEQKNKTEALKNGLDNSKKNYEEMGTKIDKLRESYKNAEKEMKRMEQSGTATDDELKKQKETVSQLSENLKKSEENYVTAGNRVKDWEKKLNDAETEVIKTSREVEKNAKYMDEAKGAADGCAKSIDNFGKEVKQTSKELEESGTNAKKFGDSTKDSIDALAGTIVASGLANGVKEIATTMYECVEAAEAFETGMAKVYTIADEGSVPIDAMKNSILELSSSSGIAATDVANNVYDAISAGQDTADAVNFVENSTKLATAGFAESGQTLDVLTTILNAYGMESKDATKVSDMLIQTQNKGKVTVAELAASMGKVIPTANASNVSLDNLCAGYAIMTSKGIKAAETTTYMNSMLNELSKSGTIANSTLKNVSGSSFQELMASGKSLGDVLQILQDEATKSEKNLADMFGSAEAGKAAVSMLSDGVDGFNSQVTGMLDSAGATEVAFQKMASTAEFQKTKMVNAIDNTKIAIGEQLAPTLKNLYKIGANVFEWATEFVKDNPAVVRAIVAVASAATTLAVAFAGFTVVQKLTPLIKAFNAALSGNPYILVATAIIGIVTAFASLASGMEETTTEAQRAAQKSREEYDKLLESIKTSDEAHSQSVASIQEEYGACETLAEKLVDLSEKENKSAGDKALMATYVDQLNEKIPGLNLAIDGTTGALNMENDALLASVDSMKKKAEAAAWGDRLTELAKDRIALEEKQKESTENLKKAEADLVRVEKEKGLTYEELMEKLHGIGTATGQWAYLQKEECKAVMEAQDSVIAYKGEIINYGNDLETVGEKEDEAANKVKDLGDAHLDTGEKAAEAAEAQKKAAQEAEEAEAARVDELIQKYEQLQSSIESSVQSSISAFNEFDGGTKISAETLNANLDSQIAGLENWSENMRILAQQGGNGMTSEFYEYLAEMGPKGANLVQTMVNQIEEEGDFSGICEKMMQTLDLPESISKEMTIAEAKLAGDMDIIAHTTLQGAGKINNAMSGVNGGNLTGTLGSAMQDAASIVENAGGQLSESAKTSFNAAVEAAEKCGAEIPQDLAENLSNGSTSVEAATDTINNSIQNKMTSLIQDASAMGIQLPQSLQQGIEQGTIGPVQAIAAINELLAAEQAKGAAAAQEGGAQITNSTTSGMQSKQSDMITVAGAIAQGSASVIDSYQSRFSEAGSGLADSLGSGFASNTNGFMQNAGAAANGGASVASSYSGSYSSAGYNLASGLAGGISNGASLAINAAANMAERALAAAKARLQIRSPSRRMKNEVGLMIPRGMAAGISEGQREVIARSTEMARAALEAAKKELEIHSPSAVFRKSVGHQISNGVAFGIKDKAGSAKKSAEQLSKEVSNAAGKWLSAYSKKHKFSLADEEYYWREVQKKVKKGTSGYSEISKKVFNADTADRISKLSKNQLKEAEAALSKRKKISNMSLADEENYWRKMQKGIKKNTADYQTVANKTFSLNTARKISTSKSDNKIGDAQKLLDVNKKTKKMTLADEEYFWNSIKKAVKKGTAEYNEASKRAFYADSADKVSKLSKNQVKEAEVILSANRKNRKINLADEENYWKKVQKGLKKNSAEYQTVANKIFSLNTARKVGTSKSDNRVGDAQKILDDNRKTRNISLADEKNYWKQMKRVTKTNSEEYKAINKKIFNAEAAARVSKVSGSKLGAAYSELDKYKANNKTNKMSIQDEIDYWKKIKTVMKSGTAEYEKTAKKIRDLSTYKIVAAKGNFGVSATYTDGDKKGKKKSNSVYSNEVMEAGMKWMDAWKQRSDVTIQQEIVFWDKIRKQLKKGTQAYNEATKNMEDAKKQANQELLSNSGSLLDGYKTYKSVSMKGEVDYWNIVRKQFKSGTQERIEADKQYLEAKANLTEKKKELDKEYQENSKEINAKLKEDVKSLTDAYKEEVKNRKDSIYSSFGLFDEFESKSQSGKQLLYNLKTQVAGIADWEQQLGSLGSRKGMDKGLMEELQAMGPEASASIHALNSLTDKELAEYVEMWKKKNNLAQAQAEKESEPLKKSTEKQVAALKTTAQKELDALRKTYEKEVAGISAGISDKLKSLAYSTNKYGEDAVAKLLAGMTNAADKSSSVSMTKVKKTVISGLSSLPTTGKALGKDTLQGILDGLTNKKKMDKTAKDFINQLKKSIQQAAEIKSPSKLFKREIGAFLSSGVGEGITDNEEKAIKPATAMMRKMTEAIKKEMPENLDLSAKLMASIGTEEQEASMQAMQQNAAYLTQNATQGVTLVDKMNQILTMMEQYFPKIGEGQIVMDNGTLVGETYAGIGQQLVQAARRFR